MHEVEAVAHDDERQLVGQLGLLQEVLHALGVVAVRLAADALHLLDLTGLARRLEETKHFIQRNRTFLGERA